MPAYYPVKPFGIYRRQTFRTTLLTQDAPHLSIAIHRHIAAEVRNITQVCFVFTPVTAPVLPAGRRLNPRTRHAHGAADLCNSPSSCTEHAEAPEPASAPLCEFRSQHDVFSGSNDCEATFRRWSLPIERLDGLNTVQASDMRNIHARLHRLPDNGELFLRSLKFTDFLP